MTQRILIVDDDPSIIKIMRGYLEQAGYDVLAAADGARALQLVRQERPDLVVLDVMLPQHDGWPPAPHSCGCGAGGHPHHPADGTRGRHR